MSLLERKIVRVIMTFLNSKGSNFRVQRAASPGQQPSVGPRKSALRDAVNTNHGRRHVVGNEKNEQHATRVPSGASALTMTLILSLPVRVSSACRWHRAGAGPSGADRRRRTPRARANAPRPASLTSTAASAPVPRTSRARPCWKPSTCCRRPRMEQQALPRFDRVHEGRPQRAQPLFLGDTARLASAR